MLYRRYYDQTQKVASFLTRLYKLRVPIITVLSVLALTAVSLAAAKGLVLSDTIGAPQITYGESVSCEARAFLGDVRYEYRRVEDSTWSDGLPENAGTYFLRAVGQSFFGNPRYGKEHSLTIAPAPITVSVADNEVLYGETPALQAELRPGHVVEGEVSYDTLGDTVTPQVTPVRDSLRITDAAGKDMLANYTVTDVLTTTITIIPQDLSVTVEDREKIFDDLALTYDGYELTEGTLIEGDRMVAVVKDSITDVGTVPNAPLMQVFNADGVNVSIHYAIALTEGKLTVNTRPLYVQTGSQTTVYDGEAHACTEWTVGAEMPLVEGHDIRVSDRATTSVLHVGETENYLAFDIFNADGGDETANYNLFLTCGTLAVTPRPVHIVTSSATFEYDGLAHSATELPDGYAAVGDTLEIVPASVVTVRDVAEGARENALTVSFKRNGIDVSDNYTIIYEIGTLTVTPRPIRVETVTSSVIYDAEAHSAPDYKLVYTGLLEADYVLPEGDVAVVREGSLMSGTDAGDYVNTFELMFTRPTEADADVSDNYDVEYVYGTLQILRRPVALAVKDQIKVYDGTPLSGREGTAIEDPEAGLTSLVVGHVLHLDTVGEQVNAGSGVNHYVDQSARIFEGETDVTANYEILSVKDGLLTVLQRPITVTGGSFVWLYDALPHSLPDVYTVTRSEKPADPLWETVEWELEGTPLPDGQIESVQLNGSCTNVARDPDGNYAAYENQVSEVIIRNTVDGTIVTENYLITRASGELTILPRPMTVTAISECRLYNGQPQTLENYALTWTEKPSGDLWQDIDLSAAGTPLLPEHIERVQILGMYTDVARNADGGYMPREQQVGDVIIRNAIDGRVVTDNYLITRVSGELTLLPRPVTVTSASQSWMYDGLEHVLHETEVDRWSPLPTGAQWEGITLPAREESPLLDNHFKVIRYTGACTFVTRSGDAIQSVPNTYESFGNLSRILNEFGTDVTHNYLITEKFGELTITPRPLIIQCGGGYKVYDGMAVSYADWEIPADSLPLPTMPWHSVLPIEVPNFVNAGTYPNRFSVEIYAGDVLVNDSFDITYREGSVVIAPRPVALKIVDREREYNGLPLRSDGSTNFLGDYPGAMPPVDGHYATVNAVGEQITVGSSMAVYQNGTLVIRDVFDNDQTANYRVIHMENAKLTVYPRPITIHTASAVKQYDGTPLTAADVTVGTEGMTLVSGQRIELTVTGSQTEVGKSDNTYDPRSLRIYDEEGTNVTYCYAVTLIPGTLEVVQKDDPDGPPPPPPAQEYDPDDSEGTETVVGKLLSPYSGNIYLREESAGDYLGDARYWGIPVSYDQLLPGGYSFNYFPGYHLVSGGVNAEVMKFRDMLISALPYYPVVGDADSPVQSSDVQYYVDNTSYQISYALPDASILAWINGHFRNLTEDQRRDLLGENYDAELAYREAVYEQYLQIDDETRDYMQALIKEQGFDLNDPGVISQIAHFVQNSAAYNSKYDRAMDAEGNVAVTFLRDYREGICVHYATSATMLFRALGIPARYTTGFLVKDVSADAWTDIISGGKRNMGHAWVEVYIDGFGWVMVEVTGSSNDSGDQETIKLELTPVTLTKQYDGLPLYHNNSLLESDLLGTLCSQGYRYEAVVSGMQIDVGTSPAIIESCKIFDPNGVDVTDHFNLIFHKGELRVIDTDINLNVYLPQHLKEYDGEYLTYGTDEYYILSQTPEGFELDLRLQISFVDAMTLTLHDLNANFDEFASFTATLNGKDVTHRVSITFVTIRQENDPNAVVAQITQRWLQLTANSKTESYSEGAVIRDSGWTNSANPVLDGHYIDTDAVTVLGFCDNPTQPSMNQIDPYSVFIYDQNGQNVTQNYQIELINGILQFADE